MKIGAHVSAAGGLSKALTRGSDSDARPFKYSLTLLKVGDSILSANPKNAHSVKTLLKPVLLLYIFTQSISLTSALKTL